MLSEDMKPCRKRILLVCRKEDPLSEGFRRQGALYCRGSTPHVRPSRSGVRGGGGVDGTDRFKDIKNSVGQTLRNNVGKIL